MKRLHLLIILLTIAKAISAQSVPELYKQNKSATYKQAIEFYKAAAKDPRCNYTENGLTDCGKPLPLFIFSPSKEFNPAKLHQQNKVIILINNGIHPGEPDGIDACISIVNELLHNEFMVPDNVVIAIIPVYNIDGALNRSCCSRANQDGPEEYGFRGNNRNLDLNRDFIKTDSRNAESFETLYSTWDPDIFIDTHVSDGADYPYNITLLASQTNKLSPAIGQMMKQKLLPALYQSMLDKNEPMIPYVNVWEGTPEDGYNGFLDPPRFGSGYSALYHAFPFVTETHMLKPFTVRVEATKTFIKNMIHLADSMQNDILNARRIAKTECRIQRSFPLRWTLDTTAIEKLSFNGYKGKMKVSDVTGLPQLYYDQSDAYTKDITYRNTYVPVDSVTRPFAYILPQAWKEVASRLRMNGVKMQALKKDTVISINTYRILNFATVPEPYEGHYLHSAVKVEPAVQKKHFFAGDLLITCDQDMNRYIIETLDPRGTDSFFAWGFFDAVLQRKEWFSDYVWDIRAEGILEKDAKLKADFEAKKKSDAVFAKDPDAMLGYIYEHSDWAEKGYRIYPVGTIDSKIFEGLTQ